MKWLARLFRPWTPMHGLVGKTVAAFIAVGVVSALGAKLMSSLW